MIYLAIQDDRARRGLDYFYVLPIPGPGPISDRTRQTLFSLFSVCFLSSLFISYFLFSMFLLFSFIFIAFFLCLSCFFLSVFLCFPFSFSLVFHFCSPILFLFFRGKTDLPRIRSDDSDQDQSKTDPRPDQTRTVFTTDPTDRKNKAKSVQPIQMAR